MASGPSDENGWEHPLAVSWPGSGSIDAAISFLDRVACAPTTRTVRGIASEVEVGPEHGLPDRAVINCDHIITVPKVDLDPEAVGRLDMGSRAVLDRALRYSLDIIY